ncbi:MAG: ShlB/FhaC/HecB family hemolysin secretion/activation protein [Candidatus Omnitrophica bacterium]|nr:ShlB/FhaC/HecB family hemolysin secretion/activation protein [Candidatus Omnitrophota bacterium]
MNYKYRLLLIILLFSLLPFAQVILAQSAVERATRETDILSRPGQYQERLKEIPEKPPEPKLKEPPAAKEGEKKFYLKKIILTGCEYFACSEFDPILAKYEDKEVTLSQLQALAKELEREYLRRGVIAAAFVPAQEIKDETVTLQVVEAKMGELKIQEAKYFKNSRLSRYWKVPAGTTMRYDLLSQSIQMMNKNPDREVKAALFAGSKPGTTDVMLTPRTRFPIHGTYSFDNEGVASSGKKRVGYGIRHNNFLGFDDTFIAGSTFGRSFNGTYYYHTLPLNYSGLSVLYGYSRSESKPLKEFSGTGLKSEAVNSNISLRQDLYDKDDYIGEVFFGFDANDKTIKTNTGPINRDRERIFSIGGNFITRKVGSTTYISPEISHAVSSFGATGKNNPLASRGAYPVFTIFNLGVSHKRVLPYNLQTNLRFKGQAASRKLTPQQEFGLGGIDSVRGYPASDYLADNALFTSVELLAPAFFIPAEWKLPYAEDTLKNQTTLVGFVDYGWGMRRGALPTEKRDVNMLGIGQGVRFNLFNQALLRLEWGFPVACNNPQTEGGRGRFHFSVDFQDKLPEEIERIKKIQEEENIQRWSWALVNQELSRPGSALGKKVYGLLHSAREAYKDGKFKESMKYYEDLRDTSMSLYRQAEDYVRSCLEQEKELKASLKLASTTSQQGNVNEAKQLWQKIISDSRPKQLILEF